MKTFFSFSFLYFKVSVWSAFWMMQDYSSFAVVKRLSLFTDQIETFREEEVNSFDCLQQIDKGTEKVRTIITAL
jgi:hypothetical protein